MRLALSAALAFVGLGTKGAIAAFYFASGAATSDDGAAYIYRRSDVAAERCRGHTSRASVLRGCVGRLRRRLAPRYAKVEGGDAPL